MSAIAPATKTRRSINHSWRVQLTTNSCMVNTSGIPEMMGQFPGNPYNWWFYSRFCSVFNHQPVNPSMVIHTAAVDRLATTLVEGNRMIPWVHGSLLMVNEPWWPRNFRRPVPSMTHSTTYPQEFSAPCWTEGFFNHHFNSDWSLWRPGIQGFGAVDAVVLILW